MDAAIVRCSEWVGREETREDVVTAAPLSALSALLDRDDPPPRAGDAAPPLAHWLYFLPHYRQSEAGPDGHAARGSFAVSSGASKPACAQMNNFFLEVL